MASQVCFHCQQQVEAGEAHDCWTTTEAALTRHLPDDLQDAWQRLREEAVALGEQRVYASHHSIMFSRVACYCFVRPKKHFLEVCLFLGRTVAGPLVRRSAPTSSTKIAHTLHIRHRDQIEAPVTEWLQEAYEFGGQKAAARNRAAAKAAAGGSVSNKAVRGRTGAAKTGTKKRGVTKRATRTGRS